MTEVFLYILRLGLGLDAPGGIDRRLSDDEWQQLIDLGVKHAVTGMLYAGMERLPDEVLPSKDLRLKLIAMVMRVRQANERLNRLCGEVTGQLDALGYDSCVLKGQGVARLYPDPRLRNAGDIDMWVRPKGAVAEADVDGYLPDMLRAVRSTGVGRLGKVIYYHVGWERPDVEVELHYRVSWFNYPGYDRVLHQWAARQWDSRTQVDGYYVLSPAFNAVYLMVHIYRHLLNEGIGLRQVIDYAMLLMSHSYNDAQRREITDTLRRLGMRRFSAAMMWVMAEVMHVPAERLIGPVDEKRGREFYGEFLQSGNFGRYDQRIDHSLHSSVAGTFWLRTKHRARFVAAYPMEVLCDIPYRLWHWAWRRKYNREEDPAREATGS